MAPDFPESRRVLLARARACMELTSSDRAAGAAPAWNVGGKDRNAAALQAVPLVRAWIACGLALDRCKDDPELRFSARNLLARAYVRMSCPGTASFLLPLGLAHARMAAGESPGHHEEIARLLEFVGARATALGQHSEAVGAYTALVAQDARSEEWLLAPKKLAMAYRALGDRQGALEWNKQFVREYAERVDRYLAHAEQQPVGEHKGYLMNRSRFDARDASARLEKEAIDTALELGDITQAQQARRGLQLDLPGYVPARDHWLERARSEAKAGNRDEALACYLRALKPARTVLPEMQAKHAANQAYLDAVRKPQSPEELREIFGYLCGDVVRSPGLSRKREEGPQPPQTSSPLGEAGNADDNSPGCAVSVAWSAYWELQRDGRRREARKVLERLAQHLARDLGNPASAVLALLAHLTIAKSYQQEGLSFRAIEAFDAAEERLNAHESLGREISHAVHEFFRTSIAYGRALPRFRDGQYETAAKEFDKVKSAGHVVPQAMYRIAQCREFEGRFSDARRKYEGAASLDSCPGQLRRMALFATKRLKAHWAQSRSVSKRRKEVLYLGEQRADMGRWKYSHPGTRAHILCGMHSPADIVSAHGGPPRISSTLESLPLNYSLSTTDPNEGGRRWVSRVDDPSPSSLWNPLRHSLTSSNWDDAGEQRALGEGPDVVASLDVGEGVWQIAVYFANDHNFWEPNRKWTVYLKDSDGRFLAACDVEDHLCGVWKRFAVSGPLSLRLHVSRDLSLNALVTGIFVDPLVTVLPDPPRSETLGIEVPAGSTVQQVEREFGNLLDLLRKSPMKYAGKRLSLWQLACAAGRIAERINQPGDAAPHGRARARASWIRWQCLRMLGLSADCERRAIEDWARARASSDGAAGARRAMVHLRNWSRARGELGRSELLEDARLAVFLPSETRTDQVEQLLRSALDYCSEDQLYALEKLEAALAMLGDEVESPLRYACLKRLAKASRVRKAWRLAERVYTEMSATCPVGLLDDEYYQHHFRTLITLGERDRALEVLRRDIRERPGSKWERVWRLNLVSLLLIKGEVDEAISEYEALPAGTRTDASGANMEFNIAVALLDRKRDESAARARFARVAAEFPGTHWAQKAQSFLQQIGEPPK